MKHHEVIGYAIEGAFYCTHHAQVDEGDTECGHATAVFAGDEGAGEMTCDGCLAEEVTARDSIEGPAHTPYYLDETSIEARRMTSVPTSGQTRSGYGSRLPTAWQLRIAGRWYRVRVMCWSNSGTAYVERAGKRLLLGAYDPNHDTTRPLAV
jgi:hypothetical protein